MNEDEISEIRRKNIGIVFQSFYLIPNYTALENVSLSLEINKFDNPTVKAKEILDRFGLSNRFNNFPSQLSGGEQTRACIARALASNPLVLLCDEPTGNLDPELSIQIITLLEKINRAGTTVLMATHDSSIVNRRKKRVLQLKDGKLMSDVDQGRYV